MFPRCVLVFIITLLLQGCGGSSTLSTDVATDDVTDQDTESLQQGFINGYVLVLETFRTPDDTGIFKDFWEHDPVAQTFSYSIAFNRPDAVSGDRVYSTIRYDQRGYPVERISYDRNGEPTSTGRSEFSDDGRLLSTSATTDSLPGETLLEEYDHDIAGRPLQGVFRLASSDAPGSINTYTYSELGLLTRFVVDNGADVFVHELTYDSNNLPISRASSSASGNFQLFKTYQHDSNSNLVSSESFDETGALIGTSEYEYERVNGPVFNARLLDLIYAPDKY